MNKIHRTVWNHARQCNVVASELARSKGKTGGSVKAVVEAVAIACLALGSTQALAGSGSCTVLNVTSAQTTNCRLDANDNLHVQAPNGSINVTSNPAVSISSGTVAGSITNSGTITSGYNAIFVGSENDGSGYITNGVTNSGLISGGGNGNGIHVYNSSALAGGIHNTGTITGGDSGVSVDSGAFYFSNSFSYGGQAHPSNLTGGIINSGTLSMIAGDSTGIYIRGSNVSGGIHNQGTISGGDSGIVVRAGENWYWNGGSSSYSSTAVPGTLSGGITNSGLIYGENSDGIYVAGSKIVGDILNSGTISGSSNGVGIHFRERYNVLSILTGSIINSGRIDGGEGIMLQSSSTIMGSITNNSTGKIIGGNTGVKVDSSSLVSGGITNSGLIAGYSNSIYVSSSSTVVGGVHNQVGGKLIGRVNLGGGTSLVNDGMLVNKYGVDPDDIANTGYATNSYVSGNYTQSATGTLRIAAAGNDGEVSYSRLYVDGTATLASGTAIVVDVTASSGATSFTPGSSLTDVISAGTLVGGADGTINVSDNSQLFNFSSFKNGNAIDLLIAAASDTGVVDSVTTTGFKSGLGAAVVLDQLIASPGGMSTLTNALGTLENEQEVSDAVAQLLPLMTGGMNLAVHNALGNANRIVQARTEENRGLSSGDSFMGDRRVWLKPFGSWADQNDRNGASGYESESYGVAIGADGVYSAQTRVGVAFAYSNSNVDGNSSVAPQSADIDTYQLVGYGSYDLDNRTAINFQADVAMSQTDGKRVITLVPSVASSEYDSWSGHLGLGLNRLYSLNEKTSVNASARADYTRIRSESYTETGAGVLNLNVGSNTTEEFVIGVDGKLIHKLDASTTLTANLGVGYDLINDQAAITASFVGGGASFVTNGIDPSPWLVRAGLGISKQIQSGMEVAVRYDIEGRNDFTNQTASVKMRWSF